MRNPPKIFLRSFKNVGPELGQEVQNKIISVT